MTRFRELGIMIAVLLSHCVASQESPLTSASWDFSAFASAQTGEEISNSFGEAQIITAGFSAGKILARDVGNSWRRGGVEYAFSVSPLFLQVRPQGLHGIAFEPLIFRWNSTHRFRHSAPYIELAGGAVHTNINLPAGNTSNFNFTVKGGAGVYLPAQAKNAFDLGVFWSHISNANLGVQNPEFNGIEVRVAYHWFR